MNDQQKTIDHTLYLLLALCGALVFLPLVAMFAVNYTQYLTAAASHQEQLSKYKGFDLQAQQEMAFWAKAMFYTSAAHIPLSAIGIFFVWRSLALNREAVAAAIAANEISREIGQRQIRAYVGIENAVVVDFGPNKYPKVEVLIKNTGQTPAYQVDIRSGLLVTEFPYFGSFNLDLKRPPRTLVLGPGQVYTIQSVLDEPLNDELVTKILNRTGIVWGVGRITYLDASKVQRVTEYLVQYGGDESNQSGRMSFAGRGNYAD